MLLVGVGPCLLEYTPTFKYIWMFAGILYQNKNIWWEAENLNILVICYIK